MGIATQLEAAIDSLLQDFVTTKSEALCAALIPIALTGATIYLLIMGLAIMRGDATDPLHTFLWKCFRMAFIGGIALVGGAYQSFVVQGTDGLSIALVESLSGFNSVGAVVDDIAKPFSELGQQLWNEAVTGFWPNFALIAAAAAVAVAEFFIVAIGLGLYLLAKVALTLVLATGPVWIMCAMWPATEKYTESWLGQLLNYVVLKVLIAACILMLTDFASQFAAHIVVAGDAVNVIKATTALVVCCGALTIVMLNLPQLAAALAGGASVAGIGRVVARAFLDSSRSPSKQPDRPSPTSGGSIAVTSHHVTAPLPSLAAPAAPLYARNTIDQIHKSR